MAWTLDKSQSLRVGQLARGCGLREITSVGYGIASLNGRQGESVELLKEIAASLKKG